MRPFRGRAQAYFMLDEMLLAGELQEPSKKAVTRVIEVQDQLVEAAKQGGGAVQGVGLAGGLWTPPPPPPPPLFMLELRHSVSPPRA